MQGPGNQHNRRRFLQTTMVMTAGGLVSLGTVHRAYGFLAANDRPQIGQIGCGGQGNGITSSASRFGDVVAVCDVDRPHAEKAKANQGKGKAEIFEDYRKLLERSDIDVVTIGTPDPELDTMIERQAVMVKDPAGRTKLIQDIQRKIIGLYGFNMILVQDQQFVSHPHVMDWNPNGLANNTLADYANTWHDK